MFSNLGSKGNYIAMPWNKHQDTLIWQKYIIMVLIKNFGEDQGSLLEASSLLSSTSRAILECFLLFPAILLWNIKWFSVWIRVYISMRHTEKKKKKPIPLSLPGCARDTLSTLFWLYSFQAKSLFSTHWPTMEKKEYRKTRTVAQYYAPTPVLVIER